MIGSGRDPKQWIEPNKFMPERFDHKSPLSLTPDGQKRHLQAYNVFFGGKRVCLGKGFAERLVAMIVPNILMQLDF
jgi:cytochrome P450